MQSPDLKLSSPVLSNPGHTLFAGKLRIDSNLVKKNQNSGILPFDC